MSPFSDFDDFLFEAEESEDSQKGVNASKNWVILVVDDDVSVHVATKLCLQNMVVHGRKITIMSAYSGKEACAILEKIIGIHLVLLDCIMETAEAGFEVARYLKIHLGRSTPIIVMRTGYAGLGTEDNLESHKELDAFLNKSEATSKVLYDVLCHWLPVSV